VTIIWDLILIVIVCGVLRTTLSFIGGNYECDDGGETQKARRCLILDDPAWVKCSTSTIWNAIRTVIISTVITIEVAATPDFIHRQLDINL